ncbi:hypothetical protein OAory_01093120 [Aspergillus oryzae]|uniref:Uncharacterized protein n=1 Tax=Aspergillus oryzae TaxID=5062 RepID=A0A1S9DDN5_ASPOZ|nr:hypothetical protein OAory_01093120 [Aspergillus oryzae]
MAATQTIQVPHLGGIKAGYALSNDHYDPSKPTCVLINSMCMTVSLYHDQFNNKELTDAMNLLAIEPLGHGATSCPSEHFTYWDSAIMALQVMDHFGIQKAFALGTSQGGWMVTRMALLAPDRILGLMPLGTSMDYESADSRSKGCWDPAASLTAFYDKWTSPLATPDFVVDDVWCGLVGGIGFGAAATAEKSAFWTQTLKEVYKGDEGRKKVRMALNCLLERDGLLLRLRDIKCPVYWLQGTEDTPFGTVVPAEQIKLFTASPEAKLVMIEGGAHYLNATNPKEVNEALLEMVTKLFTTRLRGIWLHGIGLHLMENDQGDLQQWSIATTASVTVLAFVTVCLRLLARYERKQKLWWDDYMIIFSMLWNLVVVGFIYAMIKEGMGLHADTIPTSNVVMIAKFLVVAEILYVFNLVWTKLSILLMYYRIFRFPYFKTWAYIIGTFVILWVICITFLFIFICVPVEKLCVVFASAYRFSVLFTYTATDSSYTLAPTVGWTAIEMSAGIVSACLPTLRPALRYMARKLGLHGRLPALFQSTTGQMSKTSIPATGPSRTEDSTATIIQHSERPKRHSFYHLPDETDSAGEQGHSDTSFRPDYAKTFTNVLGPRPQSELGARMEFETSGAVCPAIVLEEREYLVSWNMRFIRGYLELLAGEHSGEAKSLVVED